MGADGAAQHNSSAGIITKSDIASKGDSLPDKPIPAAVRAYEIQHDPAALPAVLKELAAAVGAERHDVHAVTMTAELSQLFRRKRDGVVFVLDAVVAAFPDSDIRVYTTQGDFLTMEDARRQPLACAASNWAAAARAVARIVPDAILVDIGTTTTDVVPLVDGSLCATGWTDPARLASGELLYLGAVRTPVEAIVQRVPFDDGDAGVSAESFALAGDVHVWRGTLIPLMYSAPTPDGRSTSREAIGERLARIVCADREMLDDQSIDRIADAVAEAQIARTAAAHRPGAIAPSRPPDRRGDGDRRFLGGCGGGAGGVIGAVPLACAGRRRGTRRTGGVRGDTPDGRAERQVDAAHGSERSS